MTHVQDGDDPMFIRDRYYAGPIEVEPPDSPPTELVFTHGKAAFKGPGTYVWTLGPDARSVNRGYVSKHVADEMHDFFWYAGPLDAKFVGRGEVKEGGGAVSDLPLDPEHSPRSEGVLRDMWVVVDECGGYSFYHHDEETARKFLNIDPGTKRRLYRMTAVLVAESGEGGGS